MSIARLTLTVYNTVSCRSTIYYVFKNKCGVYTFCRSIGEVKLRTSCAYDLPVVDPHYLEHPDDVAVMREGCKYVANVLAKQKAYANLLGRSHIHFSLLARHSFSN